MPGPSASLAAYRLEVAQPHRTTHHPQGLRPSRKRDELKLVAPDFVEAVPNPQAATLPALLTIFPVEWSALASVVSSRDPWPRPACRDRQACPVDRGAPKHTVCLKAARGVTNARVLQSRSANAQRISMAAVMGITILDRPC